MPIAEALLSLLAPHECLSCGHEASLICSACQYNVFDQVPSRCYRCLTKTKDSAMCMKCRASSSLKHVWVGTEYDGIAKELVRLFKFERARAAYKPITEHIAGTLPYLDNETIITYIPTATSRNRMRGYDQSRLIARQLAKNRSLRFIPMFERYGQTRQVGATRNERLKQAERMFRLKGVTVPKNARIIIIDDIVTTGASLEAAAGLLKRAGIKYVSAAVFAQKH